MNFVDVIKALFSNYTLITVASAWFWAQFAKGVQGVIREKSIKGMRHIGANGGMPSSHAAGVSALCAASACLYGLDSFQFGGTFLFAMLIMNDAFGVRYEVGKHAKILNRFMKKDNVEAEEKIKEAVGHTPLQVVVGSAFGIAIALFLYFVVYN